MSPDYTKMHLWAFGTSQNFLGNQNFLKGMGFSCAVVDFLKKCPET
jgi:hypothetical protein